MPRSTAEHAEIAEDSYGSFSAGSAGSAVYVVILLTLFGSNGDRDQKSIWAVSFANRAGRIRFGVSHAPLTMKVWL